MHRSIDRDPTIRSTDPSRIVIDRVFDVFHPRDPLDAVDSHDITSTPTNDRHRDVDRIGIRGWA
jgi:hypothetical protein